MARDLRLEITGDSRSGQKALDAVADESDHAAVTLRALGAEMKKAAREGGHLKDELDEVSGKAVKAGDSVYVLGKKVNETGDEMSATARAAAKLDAELAAAAAQMSIAARAAEKLDRQLDASRSGIAKLNEELAATDDPAKVITALQKQYREYDKIANVRKRIAKDEEEARKRALQAEKAIAALEGGPAKVLEGNHSDKNLILRFLGALGGGLDRLGSATSKGVSEVADNISPSGVVKAAIGVAAAPAVGTIAGGAALAGGAFAGAGLGVAGAIANNPEPFRKAWTDAIQEISHRWQMASLGFEKPALNAFHVLKAAVDDIHIEEILKSAEKYVEPLSHGIAGFIKPLANGIGQLVEKAGPVVDVLEHDLPLLGQAVEQAFSDIGDGADGGAAALDVLLKSIAGVTMALGSFIKIAEEGYGWLAKYGDVLGISDKTTLSYGRTLDGTGMSVDKFAKSEESLSESMKKASDAMSTQLDNLLALDEANTAAADGVQRLKDAFKENGNQLSGNSEKALANQRVLEQVIGDYKRQRDAAIDAGDQSAVSIGKANTVLRQHLEDLRAVLVAHHQDTTAVDDYIAKLDSLDGKVVSVKVNVKYQEYNPGIALGNLLHHARGGETLGGPIVTGEHGPEITWPSRGSYISTTEETRKLASMMGSATGGSGGGALTLVLQGGDSFLGQLMAYAVERGYAQFYDSNGKLISTRRG